MTSARQTQIALSLDDKEYRDAFVSEEIDVGLAFQIRAMRTARDWTQCDLATRTGMAQETISRLESLDYGKYSLSTLKRLASAFDVGLAVRFASFSELVRFAANMAPQDLTVPSFENDTSLKVFQTTLTPLGRTAPIAGTTISTTHDGRSDPFRTSFISGRLPTSSSCYRFLDLTGVSIAKEKSTASLTAWSQQSLVEMAYTNTRSGSFVESNDLQHPVYRKAA